MTGPHSGREAGRRIRALLRAGTCAASYRSVFTYASVSGYGACIQRCAKLCRGTSALAGHVLLSLPEDPEAGDTPWQRTQTRLNNPRAMIAPNSETARELAGRLLATGSQGPPSRGETSSQLPAAARVGRHLALDLSRWFGPYGYHALLARALARARLEHCVLDSVHVGPPSAPYLSGLEDAAQAHGIDATTAGVAAVLAALIDLLGRLIGDDLAVMFIDQTIQSMATGSAGVADATDLTARPRPEGAP